MPCTKCCCALYANANTGGVLFLHRGKCVLLTGLYTGLRCVAVICPLRFGYSPKHEVLS